MNIIEIHNNDRNTCDKKGPYLKVNGGSGPTQAHAHVHNSKKARSDVFVRPLILSLHR